MTTNMKWLNGFIKRENNFWGKANGFPSELDSAQDNFFSKLQRVEENAKTLCNLARNSKEKDTAKFEFASTLSKESLLISVFKEIYEAVIESNGKYRFFDKDSFFKLCPHYFDSVDERKNLSGQYINSYLDSTFYHHMLDACLFTTLCNFIHETKQKNGLSIQKALEKYYKPKRDIKNAKLVVDESEKANIRKMKERLFSERGSENKRPEWSAIPLDSAFELSIMYELRFYDFLKKEFDDRELVDEKLARVYKRIGNLNKDIKKAFSQPHNNYSQETLDDAIKRFLSKTKKIKYEDYLALGKYILSNICEDKEYYGINLYRFEKGLRLYGTTNDVKLLLNCSDKEKESIILDNIFRLRDIPFPKLYQCFCYIESPVNFFQCIEAFYDIRDNVVWASRLVLDELVRDDCFGENDEWYYFFLNMINNMAEQVLYDPAKIDYSIAPESQVKFEQVLSAPARFFKKYAK